MSGTLGKNTVGKGTIESLWIRVKGQTIDLNVIMGVYYRPPGQDNELFFEETKDPSRLTALSL